MHPDYPEDNSVPNKKDVPSEAPPVGEEVTSHPLRVETELSLQQSSSSPLLQPLPSPSLSPAPTNLSITAEGSDRLQQQQQQQQQHVHAIAQQQSPAGDLSAHLNPYFPYHPAAGQQPQFPYPQAVPMISAQALLHGARAVSHLVQQQQQQQSQLSSRHPSYSDPDSRQNKSDQFMS